MTSGQGAEVKTNKGANTRGSWMCPAREALWLWLSVIAAVLAVAGSVTALSVKSIYATLTPAFLAEALVRDCPIGEDIMCVAPH